jgi:D-tyrosyl-tRNA(Tyr) deacylase
VRSVIQRVSRASVRVDGESVGAIERGVLILVGVAHNDDESEARRIARKCAEMRVFPDDAGRFDRSLIDVAGAALVVPQFTLLADIRKGRRPSFTEAAPPELAAPLVEAFANELRSLGVEVATGRFGASMQVELVNDGPVTIVVDSDDLDRPRRS